MEDSFHSGKIKILKSKYMKKKNRECNIYYSFINKNSYDPLYRMQLFFKKGSDSASCSP